MVLSIPFLRVVERLFVTPSGSFGGFRLNTSFRCESRVGCFPDIALKRARPAPNREKGTDGRNRIWEPNASDLQA